MVSCFQKKLMMKGEENDGSQVVKDALKTTIILVSQKINNRMYVKEISDNNKRNIKKKLR